MSLGRCNCPRYTIPSADPNDSRGCPVHDPDYVDPEVTIRELHALLDKERRLAFKAGWRYAEKWFQDNGAYRPTGAYERWMSRRGKK